jgi:tRNA pseudouridine38-40 synthase
VISFWIRNDLSPDVVVRALNHYLPEDIAIRGACVIDGDFDVRRRALSRRYVYRIAHQPTRAPMVDRYCLVVKDSLNVGLMRQAARELNGVHDFASFATSLEDGETTVRVVHEARIVETEDMIECSIVANAFLRHQVRNTVGQLLRVGLEKCSPDEFADLVDRPRRASAGPAAPSRGLCLSGVRYEEPLPFAA